MLSMSSFHSVAICVNVCIGKEKCTNLIIIVLTYQILYYYLIYRTSNVEICVCVYVYVCVYVCVCCVLF